MDADVEPSRETVPLAEIPDAPTPPPVEDRQQGISHAVEEEWQSEDRDVAAPTGSWMKVLGYFMLLLVLASGGALVCHFGLNESQGDFALLGIDTQEVEFVTARREDGSAVLMVRGKVVNTTMGAKQLITVNAQVVEQGGQVVREKRAPCGNTWTAADLSTLSQSDITTQYQRLEQSDRMVPPNGEITCSVVLDSVPPGFLSSASSYQPRLVVIQADPVTYGSQ